MKRDIRKIIKFNEDEWNTVRARAAFKNMKAGKFIRVMSVQGILKIFDLRTFNNLLVSFNRIGAELYQIIRIAKNENSPFLPELLKMENEYKGYLKKFIKYLSPLRPEVLLNG